jgi:hypothetical protein
MKKLILLLCIVLLVGTVSAAEWDNVKDYDEKTKTVTVKNALGLPFFGSTIATIKLNTPLNYYVPRGYQKVAEFELSLYEDYTTAFKELELYDMKNNYEKFNRSYDYKYKTTEQVPDHKRVCDKGLDENGTLGDINCRWEQSGTKDKVVWNDLNSLDFGKDETLTIGIFTTVEKGDYVEWIPNFFGTRINEWATWTENFNTDLELYYRLEETSGVVVDASTNSRDGTNNGSTRGVPGIIDNAFNFTKANGNFVNQSSDLGISDFPMSYSVWFRSATKPGSGEMAIITMGATSNDDVDYEIRVKGASGFLSLLARDGTSTDATDTAIDVLNDSWQNVVVVFNNNTGRDLYLNGVSVINDTDSVTFNDSTLKFRLGSVVSVGGSPTNFWNGTIDEAGVWSRALNFSEIRDLWNGGAGISPPPVAVEVTLNSPVNTSNLTVSSIQFNATINSTIGGALDNATHFVWFSNGTLFNQTTIDISGTLNTTNLTVNNFVIDDYLWNVEGCKADGNCSFASSNGTFSVGSNIGAITLNSTTFETKTESYSIEIETFDGIQPTNANLNFNGTLTSATVTDEGGGNFSLSLTRDVAGITGSSATFVINFTWDVGSTSEVSSSSNQVVSELLLDLCNASLTVPFINFSFLNETLAEESVNATFDSNWNFYLGTGSEMITFSFLNATENPGYDFCVSAANDTLATQVNVSYLNSISPQRQYRPTLLSLSNITTNQVLYLLPTIDGLFAQFRTEDSLGNTIVGAKGTITRTLGGSIITSAIDVTDGSGIVVYFLDPDITYSATFSKSGFVDNTFSFVPITDLRTVVMGTDAIVGNGSNISLGMNYNITPTNTTLNNGTNVLFQFNVSSGETITFMGFTISNGTTVLLSTNQTGAGSVSGTLNTGNNATFIGTFIINTSVESIVITKTWPIELGFVGDYSIFRQFTLFNDYDFRDFTRILLVFIILAGAMIFMSREEGIDEEIKMVVGILIVWAFSIVGWLDTGIVVTTTSTNINNLTQFSSQYGIAIVSTVAAAYFILRRVFRQI